MDGPRGIRGAGDLSDVEAHLLAATGARYRECLLHVAIARRGLRREADVTVGEYNEAHATRVFAIRQGHWFEMNFNGARHLFSRLPPCPKE